MPMRYALSLLITLCSCQGGSAQVVDYRKGVAYPLLGTLAEVKVSGNPEVSVESATRLSRICYLTKEYTCLVEPKDVSNGITTFDLEINDSREQFSRNPLYSYAMSVNTSQNKNFISSVSLYSSARSPKGLMDWDYRLLNTVTKVFTGVGLNRASLARCYEAAKAMAQGCTVQKVKVNGKSYDISVNFVLLDSNVPEGYRNFSMKILPAH